jgi:hypothetical protein
MENKQKLIIDKTDLTISAFIYAAFFYFSNGFEQISTRYRVLDSIIFGFFAAVLSIYLKSLLKPRIKSWLMRHKTGS